MSARGRAFVGEHQTAGDGSRDFRFFHVVGSNLQGMGSQDFTLDRFGCCVKNEDLTP
jgi:hypothetical protein